MPGIKHLIECHCTLATYKKNKKIIYHKFPVYSKINEDLDKIIEKQVQCNNCNTIHNVTGIGKSEIRLGKESSNTVITINDIMNTIPIEIQNILIKYKADVSSWEHVKDVIKESRWNECIVLSREIYKERENIKILEIISKNTFNIKNEIIDNIIIGD